MYHWHSDALFDAAGLRFSIETDAGPASYEHVLEHLENDDRFRSSFNSILAATPYAAFRWETPPLTAATAGRVFEFVVIESPELSDQADPQPFASQFRESTAEHVLEFPNLGGDALLIVPAPASSMNVYAHLASFVRSAPENQRQALWHRVGVATRRRLGQRPVWLSTAGAGVAWLHVRLDDRPKYYCFESYRHA